MATTRVSCWTWIWSTRNWAKKWLVDFNAWKLSLFRLAGLIILVLLMWNGGICSSEKKVLRFWRCFSLLNWIGALTLSLSLKLVPNRLELWFVLWCFYLLGLLYTFIILPYSLAWNTVVMSGLVLLPAT